MLIRLNIWLGTLITAELDVYERFEAVRRLNSDSGGEYAFLRNRWFIVLGWSVIMLLLMVLIAIRRMRLEKQQQEIDKRFAAEADRLQLTAEERDIVEAIARRANLKRKDSIFTMSESFDNGLAHLMQEVFAAGRDLVERKKLHGVIFSIKQKLGFVKAVGPESRSIKEQSSRHIPMGTVVKIGPAGSRQAARIHAEVIQNDRYELLLRPEMPVLSKPGDVWTISYFKAAMTWEFEAITMACSEKGLALNHSDRIRFLNRRRFTRVATHRPVHVCVFPIFEDITPATLPPITFSPADMTEIAGPGLRLKTALDVQVQQRLLVRVELEPGRMVQDCAVVRDIREGAAGRSIIVELVGVDTKAVDELVRMTNLIATRGTPVEASELRQMAGVGA